jgi:Tfp pilus assembly protein PilW
VRHRSKDESGFSLVEFLIGTLVLLVISASIFSMLAETQQTASYQTETQAVLDNSRIAMDTIGRYIRQAANDPTGAGFPGVTIVSATEVRIQSDLTGSAPGNPDKGDPDGDTADSGEDVTIRYNSGARSIDLIPGGGAAQSIANYISAFSMTYFDAAGASTTDGAAVRKVRISITGATTLPHPRTGQIFSIQQNSDVQLASRQ